MIKLRKKRKSNTANTKESQCDDADLQITITREMLENMPLPLRTLLKILFAPLLNNEENPDKEPVPPFAGCRLIIRANDWKMQEGKRVNISYDLWLCNLQGKYVCIRHETVLK